MSKTTVLLSRMARQLYEDMRFIAQLSSTQIVDDDTAKMFNNLLAEVRQNFPAIPQVFAFGEMTPRTIKYKDALVVVGQLKCIIEVATAPDGKIVPPVSKAAQKNNGGEDPNESRHDMELYGNRPPVRVNEDGTIPFSLDDEKKGEDQE